MKNKFSLADPVIKPLMVIVRLWNRIMRKLKRPFTKVTADNFLLTENKPEGVQPKVLIASSVFLNNRA